MVELKKIQMKPSENRWRIIDFGRNHLFHFGISFQENKIGFTGIFVNYIFFSGGRIGTINHGHGIQPYLGIRSGKPYWNYRKKWNYYV